MPADLLPLEVLRATLAGLVGILKGAAPAVHLLTLQDWHCHDGYLTRTEETSWTALEHSCASLDALRAAGRLETFVYRAIYPADFRFLLRFLVLDEHEDELYPGNWGTFDLSGARALVEAARDGLPAGVRSQLILEPSGEFFDRGYAG